ncbi:MAG: beta-lactamase family protein [Clostridia bacterium]|nr:beta-lactamase family protein [Clostridia bacterium]
MAFEALTQYLEHLPAEGVPGCDMEIRVGYEPVYRHRVGLGRPNRPMTGDETYWFYSATKLYTMTAVMQQIERGKLRLDMPVAEVLPEFGELTVRESDGTVRPARTVLTLRHLMSMQGGLDYDRDTPEIHEVQRLYGAKATTRQLVAAFARHPLQFDPGTHFLYSLCHDVAAAMVEVVSGMTYGEYLKRNILEPLGSTGVTTRPGEQEIAALAQRYIWDENGHLSKTPDLTSNEYMLSDAYESGGACLMGTLDGYMPLPEALANGGVGRTGKRILTQESIHTMRTDQMHGASVQDFGKLERPGYSYALGVRVLVDDGPSRSPIGEFGWDGAAGAWVMIDTERHVSCVYLQHVLNCGRAYAEFHPAIRDLVYEGLETL